jgi:signal transduction histidine kinase/CheY-like chemotaxis protein
MQLKNLPAALTNVGVTEHLKIEEAQIVRLTNLFGIFPFFFFLVYIINGVVYDISFFWQIGVINALFNLLCLWCNHKQYYAAAKTILLSSNSFILLLFANVVVGNASAVAFFFPVLTCYVVFYDILKEWKTVIINLAVTATCILLSLMLPNQFFGNVPLPDYMAGNIWKLNFILAFCAFTFYIFLIIKLKLQSETLLIQSRETAEIMANKSEQMTIQLTLQKEKAEAASRTKSLFLSNMSHELRTPLNGIIGSTNLLLQEQKDGVINQQLEVLKYSSEHMLVIINDILDFNKIEAGKLQLDRNIFNLQHLISKIATIFRQQFEAKQVSFFVEFDDRLDKEVIADDTRLTQVISNLISNALKFTHQGEVRFAIRLESSTSDVMMVSFSVSDTGIGIPENKMDAIFMSFTQADTKTNRQYGGTGLGLTISRKIVEMSGGKLKVESIVEKGSRFFFTIPIRVIQSKKSFINETTLKQLRPLKGIQVLLAEDNKINMLVARRFLNNWNVNIKEATNGLEAVELFKSNSFDLILMDLEMPVMDGYEAMAEIRKVNINIPAIAFTASVFDNMKTKLLSAGFNDFISKPFRPEELHGKIESHTFNRSALS